jgi:hypothetical protein
MVAGRVGSTSGRRARMRSGGTSPSTGSSSIRSTARRRLRRGAG